MIIEHQYVSVYCANCGDFKSFPVACGFRLCSFCRKVKYSRLFNSYLPKIKQVPFHRLSHITLTIKNFQYLNSSKVKEFYSYFIKLKRSKFFKKYVSGGIAVIECKHKDDRTGWNLHLHMLVDASFISQKELSSTWLKITGNSYIVDVRKVKDIRNDLGHLLKYFLKVPIIKGENYLDLENDYEQAFSRVRMVVSFGSLYGKISKREFDFKCEKCGSTEYITEFRLLQYNIAGGHVSVRGQPA